MMIKLLLLLALGRFYITNSSPYLGTHGSSLVQKETNGRHLGSDINQYCDSDSDCVDGSCLGTCSSNTCTYSTPQCEACNKFRFFLVIYPGLKPYAIWWEIEQAALIFPPDSTWRQQYQTRTFSKCVDYGVYTFTMYSNIYGGGLDPGRSYYSIYVNDLLLKKVSENLILLPKFSTISGCIADTNCDDGNPCTTDRCNTNTKVCENIINTQFTETCRTYGNPNVLAIRVVAPDSSTTTSESDLADYIFGTNGKLFTMTSQFSGCSRNRFNMIPFIGITTTGVSISNGVGEVELAQNVNGQVAGSIADLAINAATTKYGELLSQFNFVMLCLPPGTVIGTSTNWKAYAYLNSWLSIYNDATCNYPSVQMHEIGHNLGLSHSNDETNYGDESGMMGISYSKTDSPFKCFNAAKTWQLSWFFESHVIIDITQMARNLEYPWQKICGVTSGCERSILKVINADNGLDYYITYNSATGINNQTGEGANEVLITERESGSNYADSKLVGTLGSLQKYTILNIESGLNLQIFVRIQNKVGNLYLKKDSSTCTNANQCNDFDSCTVDECSGGVCIYTQRTCAECGAMIAIDIFTNAYPEAVTWIILNTNSEKVVQSSGYYTEANSFYEESKCLEHGKYMFSFAYDENITEGALLKYKLMVGGIIVDDAEVHNLTYTDTMFTICSTDSDCLDYDGCTIDLCNPITKLCNNTRQEKEENCVYCEWMSLEIISDNFPEETTWSITNPNVNDIILSGDPYPINAFGFGRRKAPTKSGRRKAPTRSSTGYDYSSGYNRNLLRSQLQRKLSEQVADENICLEYSFLYFFLIKDSFGDGICCSEGNGDFKLSFNNVVFKEGGDFGDSDGIMFLLKNCISDIECDDGNMCTADNCVSEQSMCIYTQKACDLCGAIFMVSFHTSHEPQENSWKVLEGNSTIMSGGPYEESFNTYNVSRCLPYGSYNFFFFDSAANGIVSLVNGNVGYYLSVNGEKAVTFDGSLGAEKEEVVVICNQDDQCDDGDLCTSDYCNMEKRFCEFTQLPCVECGKTSVTVDLITDYEGNGPWYIIDTNANTTVMQGEYYHQAFKYYSKTKCLAPGSYELRKFLITDFNTCSDYDVSATCPFTLKVNDQTIFEATPSVGEYKHFTIESVPVPTASKSLTPSQLPSNLPSSMVTTPSPSLPFLAISSQVPSIGPSHGIMYNGEDKWLIQFDHVSKKKVNSTSPAHLTIAYQISKGKVAQEVEVDVLDRSCLYWNFSSLIPVLNKEILINASSLTDKAIVSLDIDYDSLYSNSLFEYTSNESVKLPFCVRSSLLLNENSSIAVSFIETKINLHFDLDAGIMVGVALASKDAEKVWKVNYAEVSACICDTGNMSCLSEPKISQNSIIKLCVTPADTNLKVSKFQELSLFQDGITKYNPISNGVLDSLVRTYNNESTGIVEIRMIATFFEGTNPADITLDGKVMMGFIDERRELIQRDKEEADVKVSFGSFQLSMSLQQVKKTRLNLASVVVASLMICVTLFLASLSKRKSIRYSRI